MPPTALNETFSRSALPVPSTLNESALTCDFVISTDLPVRDSRYDPPTCLLSAGCDTSRYDRNPVILLDHEMLSKNVVARCLKIWPVGRELYARAQFSADDPDSLSAFNKIKAGLLRATSVSFVVTEHYDVAEGEVDSETGRTGPLRVATKWKLIEWSLVAVGANEETVARSGALFEMEDVDMPATRILNLPDIVAAATSENEDHRRLAARSIIHHYQHGRSDPLPRVRELAARFDVHATAADPDVRKWGVVDPVRVTRSAGDLIREEVTMEFAHQVLARELETVERMTPLVFGDEGYTSSIRGYSTTSIPPVDPSDTVRPAINADLRRVLPKTTLFSARFDMTREAETNLSQTRELLDLGRVLGEGLAGSVRQLMAARLAGDIPDGWGNMPTLYPTYPDSEGGNDFWATAADGLHRFANVVTGNALADKTDVNAAASGLTAMVDGDGKPLGWRVREIAAPSALEGTVRDVLEDMGALAESELRIAPFILPELDAFSTSTWYAGELSKVFARKVAIAPQFVRIHGDPLRDISHSMLAVAALDFFWLDTSGAVKCTT